MDFANVHPSPNEMNRLRAPHVAPFARPRFNFAKQSEKQEQGIDSDALVVQVAGGCTTLTKSSFSDKAESKTLRICDWVEMDFSRRREPTAAQIGKQVPETLDVRG